MKFGPTRGNPLLIFEHIIRDFGLLILMILVTVYKGPDILLDNIGIVIIAFISPLSVCLKYLSTTYSVDDEKLIIKSGVFVKKVMEIPLEAITTVDLSQNLIFQLFQVYKIKADNSSQTNDMAKEAEVVFALKKEAALQVKSLLEQKHSPQTFALHQDEKIPTQQVIDCTIFDFFLLGLMQSKFLYIFSMVPLLATVITYGASIFTTEIDEDALLERLFQDVTPAVVIVLALLCSYVIGLISSEVITTVRYFNFAVMNRGDALLVEYGLLTKKNYTLRKDKISGVALKQSVLMRIFGYCTVEVLIIGYGDQSEGSGQELSILYPIVKLSEVDRLMGQLLPDMRFDRNYKKPKKKALRYFFYTFRMLFAVCVLIGTIATGFIDEDMQYELPLIGGAVAFLLFVVFTVWMEYCNCGMYANQKVVSISTGVFSRQMLFIKTEKIESVTEISNFIKRKKGFTSISLGFLAPLRVSHIKAKNMTYEEYDEVKSILIY